jgi:hypothetical protein
MEVIPETLAALNYISTFFFFLFLLLSSIGQLLVPVYFTRLNSK